MKNLNDLIPDFGTIEVPTIDYGNYGDLSKITLVSFTAGPDLIGPFGSSTISWEVQDENSRCRVQLNGQSVPLTGSIRVNPATTMTYYLKANNGGNTKDLGEVTVQVNLQSCANDPYPYLNQTLWNFLWFRTREITGLRFRNGYSESIGVVTGSGNIHFRLDLESVVDNLPNPYVNVSGDLNLVVINNGPIIGRKKISGYFKSLSIHADYTKWQWAKVSLLGPAGLVAAAQVIDSAEQAARDNIERLFDTIIDYPVIQGNPPVGMSIQHVSLSAGADGLGLLQRRFCPAYQLPDSLGRAK